MSRRAAHESKQLGVAWGARRASEVLVAAVKVPLLVNTAEVPPHIKPK